MRIVYMGTPDFAVPALTAIAGAGHEIAAAVTQPDRPKGRGKAVVMPPVKAAAAALGIPVLQPERIKKDEAFMEKLEGLEPDVIVVAAFGQILPQRVLDVPRLGCVNIHASLLPRYRGAAPIQWAILNGEKETGITTMMMEAGLDTGDMLDQASILIGEKETGGSLHDRLSELGGKLILETLKKLEDGTAVRTPQKGEDSCYAPMLKKEMGDIDWTADASVIERLIRGLNPWPSAYTGWEGKTLKLWDADVAETAYEGLPGQVVEVTGDTLVVKAGGGALSIRQLQPEGKKRMETGAYLRGYPVRTGALFERRNS